MRACNAQAIQGGVGGRHAASQLKQARCVRAAHAQVPAGATVWCQPLQMCLGLEHGFNMDTANRWQWRPDYEGVDLPLCRRASALHCNMCHVQLRALGPADNSWGAVLPAPASYADSGTLEAAVRAGGVIHRHVLAQQQCSADVGLP